MDELTPAEMKELQELEAKVGNARPELAGLNDDEKKELEALEKQFAEKPGMVSQGLGMLGRGLDYAGGAVRTGLGSALGLATGEEALSAVEPSGQAVAGDELLKRAGVPEGPRVNLFPEFKIPMTNVTLGKGDSTAREIGGVALEAVTDPLTYASMGTSVAAKALKPTATITEKLGESLYKSGLKKVDERLIAKGSRPLSKVLMKEGVWGSPEALQTGATELAQKLAARREALYQQADDLGAKINMKRASKPALEAAKKLQKVRGAESTGKALEKYIDTYSVGKKELTKEVPDYKLISEMDALTGQKVYRRVDVADPRPGEIVTKKETWHEAADLPDVSVPEASTIKTRFYDELPNEAFNKAGRVKKDVDRINKKLALGTKQEIEREANRVSKGLGDEIKDVNADWGAIINAQKPLQNEVFKHNTKNALSSVDMAGAGYAITSPLTGLPMLVGKKMGDVAKGTRFRTGVGLGMQRTGSGTLTGPAMDALVRRGISTSPWVTLEEQKRNSGR